MSSLSQKRPRVLTVNAGSSSLKAKLFEADTVLWQAELAGIGSAELPDHKTALDRLFQDLDADFGLHTLAAVGHRVVHGGADFTAQVRVTPKNLEDLSRLIPLAPHHQPHNLAAIKSLMHRHPKLPQVACFDTAFHATMPDEAKELGLPAAYTERGIRRYGFHGLSYQSLVDRFETITGQPLPNRVIALHLGNGASLCAIKEGQSVATTMGFSTVDGIPMGTRSGSVDPGALIHLMHTENLNAEDLEELLYNRCGLLGVSGESSDMKRILESDTIGARRAIAFYTYRIAREIGSLAAALGGIDSLIFTGGIGLCAPSVREKILQQCSWLGFFVDCAANNALKTLISASTSAPAWVIETAEEYVIHRQTLSTLGCGTTQSAP